jgi:hypothetical protein
VARGEHDNSKEGDYLVMKGPPAEPCADSLIRDYLVRLTEAGLRYLPKGDRIMFVGRTKARIERELGPQRPADPARVSEVLAALGDPEDLARAERARINAEWLRRRGQDPRAAAAAVASTPYCRPLKSRRHPARDTGPLLPLPFGGRRSPGKPAARPDPGTPAPSTIPVPSITPVPSTTPAPGTPPRRFPGLAGATGLLRDTARLAASHPREAAAVTLLGLGGVLFPIVPPVWLLGSVVTVASRLWDVRDKWLAFGGPLLFTVLGAAVATTIAALFSRPGNIPVWYPHYLIAGAGVLLRLGCLASAGYLGWRVHRGPRLRPPPWKR